MALLLTLSGLDVRYGAIQAVRGRRSRGDEGEIVALLGANGAGKTTTLNAIVGLAPAEGEIRFAGEPISGRDTEEIVAQRHHAGAGRAARVPIADGRRESDARRRHAGAIRPRRWREPRRRCCDLFPILAERAGQAAARSPAASSSSWRSAAP